MNKFSGALAVAGVFFVLGSNASATIITGDVNTILVDPSPTGVDTNSHQSNTQIYAWAEQQGYTLTQALVVNAMASGSYNGAGSYINSSIAMGTIVDSFLLHYDKASGTPTVTAVFTFTSPILGLIFNTTELDQSDYIRPVGQTIDPGGNRGLDDAADIVVTADMLTLSMTATGNTLDQVRVITRSTDLASIPEPSTCALFGTGAVALAFLRRRRAR
jgi:hypothetical protein